MGILEHCHLVAVVFGLFQLESKKCTWNSGALEEMDMEHVHVTDVITGMELRVDTIMQKLFP
jgi:hypothetical protein